MGWVTVSMVVGIILAAASSTGHETPLACEALARMSALHPRHDEGDGVEKMKREKGPHPVKGEGRIF